MSRIARSHKRLIAATRVLESLGVAGLALMVLITLVDVIGSSVFGRPLVGTTEIIVVAQVVCIAAGLAFSKVNGDQIAVDFLAGRLRGRSRAALEAFCSILVLGFWVLACWMVFSYAFILQQRGTVSFSLGIPQYPFVFWIAVACCIPMCLLLVLDLTNALMRLWKGGETE